VDRTQRRTTVFVYGTLLRGESNHGLLIRSHLVGTACTQAHYELIDLGGYPAMIPGGDVPVRGEVWEVDGATLTRLDELEGHPGYYRRQELRLDDGRLVQAYLLPREQARGCPRIESGDWRRRDGSAGGEQASVG